MKQLCACGVHMVEANDATYVKDFKPMCNENTCQKVKETRNLRRVPFFDEEVRDTYVSDNRIGGEVYGKNTRYPDV